MSRYSFLFTARWLKYIAMAIIVVIACVFLALWQKDRREQREQEIATITANYSADPVAIDTVLPKPNSAISTTEEWTQVKMTGEYADADTVLARNRTVDDQPGFYVVTPFHITHGETIAVVRGFTTDEDSVPAAPKGEQTVIAHLRPAQDGSDDDNPRGMIKAIDPARIPGMDDSYSHVYAEESSDDAAGGGAAESGLTPLPMPDLDPGNHLSYMLQWFAFGIMIIIAVAISARRERKATAEAAERGTNDNELVVIDKAALDAGAKIGQPGSRYGHNRFASPTIHGQAEAEEDAMLEERFRRG